MILSRVVLPSVLMLTCAVASAGVYRWVDTEGHVHYTDKAVPNSEPVNIRTGHVAEKEAVTADPSLSGDQLTQKKADCDQKRQKYDSYKTAVKIVETDQLGRKHEYSAEEQKMLVEKAQKDMQETCAAAGVTVSSETSAATP